MPQNPMTGYEGLTLADLGDACARDWTNPYFGVVPYLAALRTLGVLDPRDAQYGMDDGTSIVAYFLSNARGWKGPVARAVKAELKVRLGR